MPTGISAAVDIGIHCIIQNGCSLYSCLVEEEVFIGAKSVIMEGVRIEKGAIIAPNSVVPPGRLIPSRQVWGGNPVQFIRDATESEVFANYTATFNHWELAKLYLQQFGPFNYAYLKKEATKDDVEIRPEDILSAGIISTEPQIKHYLV